MEANSGAQTQRERGRKVESVLSYLVGAVFPLKEAL